MRKYGSRTGWAVRDTGVRSRPDRVNPPAAAGFALTMLATTAAGDASTFAEYERIFAAAGFARSEFHPLPPTSQQAVVSTKSEPRSD